MGNRSRIVRKISNAFFYIKNFRAWFNRQENARYYDDGDIHRRTPPMSRVCEKKPACVDARNITINNVNRNLQEA